MELARGGREDLWISGRTSKTRAAGKSVRFIEPVIIVLVKTTSTATTAQSQQCVAP